MARSHGRRTSEKAAQSIDGLVEEPKVHRMDQSHTHTKRSQQVYQPGAPSRCICVVDIAAGRRTRR